MKLLSLLLCTALAILGGSSTAAAQTLNVGEVLATPIVIERETPVTSVPLEVRMGKLFMTATVNGQAREFIFDSGSPTLLTRAFADTLDLAYIGQNTGVDANGAQVTTDIAIAASLEIGSIRFVDVPVMVFDPPAGTPAGCIFDGGVIGSEVFPGSAWQIDLETGVLRIADAASRFETGAPEVAALLHDFGYPHAPIFDYSVGDIADKALFDTGSSEEVSLFQRVAEHPSVSNSIAPASVRRGRGSEGLSAGGYGAPVDLVRFSLGDFLIDGQSPGPVRAASRGVPPSLIGSGLLRRYIVTMDYPGQQLTLHARAEVEPARAEPGYSISYGGEDAVVVQLFEDSAAQAAGLQLGDVVRAAQGRDLVISSDNPLCASALWLLESFDPRAATDIAIERDGDVLTIHLPAEQR